MNNFSENIVHDSFCDVFPGEYIYEMCVGYNITNAKFWNPNNFSVRKVKVVSTIGNVPGFKNSRKFSIETSQVSPVVPVNLEFLIPSRLTNPCQEARIFGRIYFGNCVESKIYYYDSYKSVDRFYICDTAFLEEILRNMRDDYIDAQREVMREAKEQIKKFSNLLKSTEL